jgi:hypothetical protein
MAAPEAIKQDEGFRPGGRDADAKTGQLRVPHLDALLPTFELAQEQVGERLFEHLVQNQRVLKRSVGSTWVAELRA